MLIILIRHGNSIANAEENTLGIPDPEVYLTDRGKQEAHRCGRFLSNYFNCNNISLENTRMWYSPFVRTTQTANIINSYLGFDNRHFYQDSNLVEQLYGLYDGKPYSEWKIIDPISFEHYDKYYNWQNKYFVKFPLGESPFDVEQRIQLFFETIYRDYEKEGIDKLIIVTHGTTLRLFVKRWLHYHYKWFENERNPGNCWVRVIDNNKDQGYIYKGHDSRILLPDDQPENPNKIIIPRETDRVAAMRENRNLVIPKSSILTL